MNCSPNCIARFSDLKQIRFKHNASQPTVTLELTIICFASPGSRTKYGQYFLCPLSKKFGTNPSTLFHARARVNSLFKAINTLRFSLSTLRTSHAAFLASIAHLPAKPCTSVRPSFSLKSRTFFALSKSVTSSFASLDSVSTRVKSNGFKLLIFCDVHTFEASQMLLFPKSYTQLL